MPRFEFAHKFTHKWEQGLVDHPNDPGGITKDGISIRFLKDYAQKNKIDNDWLKSIGVLIPVVPDTIRSLTDDQIKAIYKRAFWDRLLPNTWPIITVVPLYDASVNSGYGQSIRFLQRACNEFKGTPLDVDGLVGPKTRARANEIANTIKGGDLDLALKHIQFREEFLQTLVKTNPNMGVFLKGWLNRTSDLKRYIS